MTDVLLLPGLNNDAHVWDGTIRALEDRGLSARAIDLPALDSLDGIVASIAPEVSPGVVLIGHSFGGAVAMAVADRHPGLLSGLVLVNAPTDADDDEAGRQRRAKAERARDGEFEAMAMAGTAVVFHGERAHDPAVRAERLRGVRAYGPERYHAHNLALVDRPDRTDWTPEGVPVLVVAAEHDRVVPTATQRAFALRHGLDYVEIPATAHMLPAEAPESLADQVASWVATSGIRSGREAIS